MSPVPNLAIQVPIFWGDRVPETQQLLAFFQRADELGFHSLWVVDRLLHPKNVPHSLTILTYAAACTTRIGLGTAVFLLSLRNPVDVARQTATLDVLAGGRLTLGVSLGGWENEYPAVNAPKEQRIGRLEEGIAVLRKLWTETDVTFHGRYYHLENANVAPKPPRPGGIPLPIGASYSEQGMRRAGRIGDGWIKGPYGSPEEFAYNWRIVQEAAREAGRDPSTLINRKELYVNVDTDRERARGELQQYVDSYWAPTGLKDQELIVGTPQEVARAVRAYGDVGCQTVALELPWPDVEKLGCG